jgi:hypothetical protein
MEKRQCRRLDQLQTRLEGEVLKRGGRTNGETWTANSPYGVPLMHAAIHQVSLTTSHLVQSPNPFNLLPLRRTLNQSKEH